MSRRYPLWFWIVAVATSLAMAQDVVVTPADIENRLRGEWVGVAGHWGKENPPASERRFVFRANGEVEAAIGAKRVVGKYRVDASRNPYHIDFMFEADGKTVTVLTVFDFVSTNQLRIAEWDPSFRRDGFRPGITFEKVQATNHALEHREPTEGLRGPSR